MTAEIDWPLEIRVFLAERMAKSGSEMLSHRIAYHLVGLEIEEFVRLEKQEKEVMGDAYKPLSDRVKLFR